MHFGEWLIVDFLQPIQMVGVVTQGRQDIDECTTEFTIEYGNSTGSLQTIKNDQGSKMVIYHRILHFKSVYRQKIYMVLYTVNNYAYFDFIAFILSKNLPIATSSVVFA